MCAIAGVIDLQMDDGSAERMIQTMIHRGPDGKGIFRQGSCALLHTRLAIIDPDGGKQPMNLEWNQEEYTITYNGEIYNADEIRVELRKLGHRFCGHSDTEVVLHAYAQWGNSCLDRLNGIFAFAVWEHRKEKLFFARDRIGVKPLFYMLHRGGIILASEIKTILAYPSVVPILDAQGAAQILLLGPGRVPGSGIFQGICELEPGVYACYENNTLHRTRYWHLKDGVHTDTLDETREKVRFLVKDAITRQMISDVPIGTFLSGGLDSSIISAVCAEKKCAEGKRLKTFSVDYRNNDQYFRPGKFQPSSDTEYIRLMQKEIDSEHFWTKLTPADLEAHLEEATCARDLPGMADVDFSLLAFCKDIRREVKVALSGECADEIFGGYPWYRDPAIRAKEGFPWAQTTSQRKELMADPLREKISAEEFVMDEYRKTCRESDILPGTSESEKRVKEMVNLNFRWFMQTLLDRKDRMSMKCGLEVRVPFCDYRIAEYLYTVPWEFKELGNMEKGLLRSAVDDLLPKKVLYRKKSPYPKTFDPEYEKRMENRIRMLLDRKDAPVYGILDRKSLVQYLEGEYEWPWYGQLMKRPQTIAYFLQINCWLEHYRVNLAF